MALTKSRKARGAPVGGDKRWADMQKRAMADGEKIFNEMRLGVSQDVALARVSERGMKAVSYLQGDHDAFLYLFGMIRTEIAVHLKVVAEMAGRIHALEEQAAEKSLKYRGVWKDQEYSPGDVVTHGGSAWHCDTKTTARPGEYIKGWTLMVKKGRDSRHVETRP